MSIRLRLAFVFTVVAAILFAVGGWLFIALLSSALLGSIDQQLAAQLSGASRYLPAHGSEAPAAGIPAPGEYVVQLIDPSGRVQGASADAGRTPMLSTAGLSRARDHRLALIRSAEGERERLLAAPLPGQPGWVAVAGVSLEAFDSTLSDVSRSLIIAGTIFVAAAGLGAYSLARAALSPVERLRRQVAALSERDQSPGIEVPRTRDEIAALAATMNDLLGRLQRALARQRRLVADTAMSCGPRSRSCAASSSWPRDPAEAGRNSLRRWPAPARRPPGSRASPSSCSSSPEATRTRWPCSWSEPTCGCY